jgi:hypothetical protein
VYPTAKRHLNHKIPPRSLGFAIRAKLQLKVILIFHAFFAHPLNQNSVRAGIVSNPEDYLYSSARNYAELETIIEVELLDIPVIVVK